MISSTILLILAIVATTTNGFQVPIGSSLSSSLKVASSSFSPRGGRWSLLLRNSADSSNESPAKATLDDEDEDDPMAAAMMDAETRLAMEKAKRANELREQEVFMTKSTGKHKCTNCEWEYDELKGDSNMIGGMIKPGTKFEELPSNWRCPVCRASKDSFQEVVEEIPGFAVNQGYGLGTNAWTSDQKSSAIFGGLFFFFVLFLSGYALS